MLPYHSSLNISVTYDLLVCCNLFVQFFFFLPHHIEYFPSQSTMHKAWPSHWLPRGACRKEGARFCNNSSPQFCEILTHVVFRGIVTSQNPYITAKVCFFLCFFAMCVRNGRISLWIPWLCDATASVCVGLIICMY